MGLFRSQGWHKMESFHALMHLFLFGLICFYFASSRRRLDCRSWRKALFEKAGYGDIISRDRAYRIIPTLRADMVLFCQI